MAVPVCHAPPLRPSRVPFVYQGEPDDETDDRPDMTTELLGLPRVEGIPGDASSLGWLVENRTAGRAARSGTRPAANPEGGLYLVRPATGQKGAGPMATT